VFEEPSGSRPDAVEPLEACEGDGGLGKGEDPLPGMMLDAGSQGADLPDHGFDPTAFGWMATRSIRSEERLLSNHTQDVVGHGTECEDQVIGGELAGRQTLQVEIGLDLGVELLVGGVIGIEGNDGIWVHRLGQGRIPSFEGIVRQEQALAVGQGRALGEAQDASYPNRSQSSPSLPDGDPFAGPGRLPKDAGIVHAGLNEGLGIVSPAIPFDQKIDRSPTCRASIGVKACQGGGNGLPMKPGVHAHEHGLGGQGQGPGQNPIQGFVSGFGRMLGAFPQLHADVPAFLPQISSDGGVADKTGISPADPLFADVRVIQGKHVQIQGDIAAGQGRNRHPCPLQELQQGGIDHRQEGFSLSVQALPEGPDSKAPRAGPALWGRRGPAGKAQWRRSRFSLGRAGPAWQSGCH